MSYFSFTTTGGTTHYVPFDTIVSFSSNKKETLVEVRPYHLHRDHASEQYTVAEEHKDFAKRLYKARQEARYQ